MIGSSTRRSAVLQGIPSGVLSRRSISGRKGEVDDSLVEMTYVPEKDVDLTAFLTLQRIVVVAIKGAAVQNSVFPLQYATVSSSLEQQCLSGEEDSHYDLPGVPVLM